MSGQHPEDEPRTEWAVEVLWRDWKKAGAKGPSSQYGPFDNIDRCQAFADTQRRDRDVLAVRVLTRTAQYTPWSGPESWVTIGEAERETLIAQHHERIMTSVIPPSEPR